eukprot:635432-Prorocentrum_minimum.AAC.1
MTQVGPLPDAEVTAKQLALEAADCGVTPLPGGGTVYPRLTSGAHSSPAKSPRAPKTGASEGDVCVTPTPAR